MKLYQYQLIPVQELRSPLSVRVPEAAGQIDAKMIEEGLNYHGRNGWKLSAIFGPMVIFEREKESPTKGNDNEHVNEGTKLGSD